MQITPEYWQTQNLLTFCVILNIFWGKCAGFDVILHICFSSSIGFFTVQAKRQKWKQFCREACGWKYAIYEI